MKIPKKWQFPLISDNQFKSSSFTELLHMKCKIHFYTSWQNTKFIVFIYCNTKNTLIQEYWHNFKTDLYIDYRYIENTCLIWWINICQIANSSRIIIEYAKYDISYCPMNGNKYRMSRLHNSVQIKIKWAKKEPEKNVMIPGLPRRAFFLISIINPILLFPENI